MKYDFSLKDRAREVNKAQIAKANNLAEQPIEITYYRNEYSFMAYPLFAQQCFQGTLTQDNQQTKKHWIEYSFNTKLGVRSFELFANVRFGMPTHRDGNILRFAISKAQEVKHKVGALPDYIEVTMYELCKRLGVKPGGTQYNQIKKSLDRLAGLQIKGNIFQQEQIFFGNLINVHYPTKADGSSAVQIVFTPDFKTILENDKTLHVIPEEILTLKGSLQIRLIELVKLRMGHKESWTVGLNNLKLLCGMPLEVTLKNFKRELKRVKIPYQITFSSQRKLVNQKVLFTPKQYYSDKP